MQPMRAPVRAVVARLVRQELKAARAARLVLERALVREQAKAAPQAPVVRQVVARLAVLARRQAALRAAMAKLAKLPASSTRRAPRSDRSLRH